MRRGGAEGNRALGLSAVLRVALLAAVATVWACGVASAAVHTRTFEWEEPEAPATLGVPKQPTAERPYLSRVRVDYDDGTGAIRVAYSLFDPSVWVRSERPPLVSVLLGSSCEHDPSELVVSVEAVSPLGPGPDVYSTQAKLAGFEGAAQGAFSQILGIEYVESVASGHFVGEHWPCVTVEPGESVNAESQTARLSGYPESVLFQGVGNGAHPRPRNVYVTGDGTLEAYKVHWKTWGGRTAIGAGTIEWHGCNPYCAADKPHTAHGEVHLSHLRECHEQLFYSKVSVYVSAHGRLRLLNGLPYNYAPC